MLVDLRRRQLGADYSPVDNQSFSLRHLQESAPREPFVDEFPGEFRDWSVNHLVFNALNLPVQTDFLEPPGYTLVSFSPLLSARLFMLPLPLPMPLPETRELANHEFLTDSLKYSEDTPRPSGELLSRWNIASTKHATSWFHYDAMGTAWTTITGEKIWFLARPDGDAASSTFNSVARRRHSYVECTNHSVGETERFEAVVVSAGSTLYVLPSSSTLCRYPFAGCLTLAEFTLQIHASRNPTLCLCN